MAINFNPDVEGIVDPEIGSNEKLWADTRRNTEDISNNFNFNSNPVIISERQCHNMSLSDGVITTRTGKIKHVVKQATRDIQLVFSNYYFPDGNSQEAMGLNNVIYKASIELSNGVIFPVFFNGLRTKTIAVGEVVISDPVPVSIAKDGYFYTRSNATVSGGEKFPLALSTIVGRSEGYTDTDTVDSGTITAAGGYFVPSPAIVIGRTPQSNAVLVVGDSIAKGTAQFPDGGFIRNSLYDLVPFNLVAVGGNSASSFMLASYRQRRLQVAKYARYAICNYGINDLNGGRTLVQLQADLTNIWTNLSAFGIKVFQTTITPYTTSTDNWATVENQTVKFFEAIRVQLNDWIRTTPSPLEGYFEVADVAESERNSGKWKVGYPYTDGLHITPTGHNAIKSAIDITKFVSF